MTGVTGKGGRAQAYGEAILRWRWSVIMITIVVFAITGYGMRFLTFSPDSRLFFGEDDPQRLALDHLENTFTKANNVLFVLAPGDGNVFTRETLAVIEALTDKAWHTPYSTRVNSITNYPHSYASGDDLIVEDLVTDAANLSESELDRIRRIALGNPDLVDLLVSSKADVTAVGVLVTKPGKGPDEVGEIAGFARALADEVRRDHPDIDVYLTGGVMADMTFEDAARRDLHSLIPLMLVVIVATLGIGLRSLSGTAATVMVIIFSVTTALGLAGWAGVTLNAATAGTPIMIMTLSVADCVHVLMTMRQQRRVGLGKFGAIIEALRVNASPIAITSLTTAIGFTTLNFSGSPPLREVGNIVAVGMVAAFAYSMTFLPAVLAVMPARAGKGAASGAVAMDRFADFVIARRRILLPTTALVIAALTVGLGRITFDDNFINYFDESFEFRTDTDFMEARLTGLNVLEYALPSGEEYGITKPDYLSKLDDFAGWFRRQEKAVHVFVLSDTIKRLNQNMHGDDPAFYRIPESRELVAQYLLLYEMSLPFGYDLNGQIDVARSTTLVTIRLANASSAEVRELGARGEAWLKEHAPGMVAPPTGLSMVYAYISEYNIRTMLSGTFVALVLISFILLFVLRSLKIGVISLAPNLIPAAMAFGLWGYLYSEVNLAVSVVGAVTLGIIVDDTVHFLSKYLRARRELGMDAGAAVRHSFATVGTALIVTSVALFLGFGVLAMSGFAISSQMGMLSAITIAFALFADFLFLSPLLVLFDKKTS